MRTKLRALLLVLVASSTSGCYLAHVARGQLDLLWAREPIERLLSDPDTPTKLRDRLDLVLRTRAFAEGLGLSVGGRYSEYAAWPGDRVVTTIVATRAGEVEPAGFWFPIVGRVPYKGYFDPERARREAERLRAGGMDVCVSHVRAYSTLGWFADPVTGPMLRQEPGALVETIFHELVHATVYVPDEAAFNEGVASFVGEEARVRFYADDQGQEAAARERRRVLANRRYRAELERARREVEALYAAEPPGPAREARRADIEARTRERISGLSLGTDPRALAAAARLNDACLGLAATYSADTARYSAALAAQREDLAAFIARVRVAAERSDPTRALLSPR
jgi:predicted aminopeptidase